MNFKRKYLLDLILFILISIVFVSCCKDVDIPGSNCIAGKGGNVQIVLYPEHHGESIPSMPGYPDSAFIKFNATEYPGEDPSLYDMIVVGETDSIFVVADSLSCGKYFIFMTGFDQSIVERVKGGIPVTIAETSGTVNIKIPVTED